KVRFGVDEVVTTLLLNFIIILFVSLLLEGPLKDPMGLGWPQTKKVVIDAQLPKLIQGKRLHFGFILALAAAGLVWIINTRMPLGYEMKAVGSNPRAARFAGMKVDRIMLKTALLSGGLAGLAGLSEVAGLKGNLTLDLSPGFGYAGIVVAMLALLHPLGVVLAAIFVAGIFVGADAMSRSAGVPSYIAQVMVAAALLAMVTALMFTRYRLRWKSSMNAIEILLSATLWAAAIRIASPLIFATLGELISERAGVLNLGIEGIMTVGAFAGWFTVYQGGDLWLGVVVAALAGALFGLLH